ncbi:MAG: arylsulfatase A-like enzyme [Paraglaciecola sp.]|jgi:arylsulfatase A-like enzyme
MNKCYLIISSVFLILFGCGGGGSETPPVEASIVDDPPATPVTPVPPVSGNDKPNILLIISDDQGLDASAQYNLSQDLPTTPTLDSLAANGLIFDNLWVTPVCTTTRSALITGKYGVNTGVTAIGDELPSSEEILHQHLANNDVTASYQSAVIGKWHLGGGNAADSHPNDMGVPHYSGFIRGTITDFSDWKVTTNGVSTQSNTYNTTALTDSAIDWIQGQTQPWFMWLAYAAPHTPFHLPPANLHSQDLSGTQSDINNNPRPYYLAAIEAMDTEIGRLLESMNDEERNNTIVFFIGDNGTPSQVTDTTVYVNGSKGTLYEGGLRVPMLISGIGVSRQNERESGLINATDFFATIAELAGNESAEIHDSVSFKALLSDTNSPTRDYIYVDFESDRVSGWAIRNQQYKLIEYTNGEQELYDLINNPQKTHELLNSGGDYSVILDELMTELNKIR